MLYVDVPKYVTVLNTFRGRFALHTVWSLASLWLKFETTGLR